MVGGGEKRESVYSKRVLERKCEKESERADVLSRVKSERPKTNESLESLSLTLFLNCAMAFRYIYRENLVESLHWLLCAFYTRTGQWRQLTIYGQRSMFNGLVTVVLYSLLSGNSHRCTHTHRHTHRHSRKYGAILLTWKLFCSCQFSFNALCTVRSSEN